MTTHPRSPQSANQVRAPRLPGTRAFFDVFNARIEPADVLMVSAVGLLGVWVRHYDTRKPGRPMSQRLAYLMDLHIWAIDRYVEDLLETADHRPAADAEEMHYSYGEMSACSPRISCAAVERNGNPAASPRIRCSTTSGTGTSSTSWWTR
ncbi:hypothetical protein [Nocardia beijingensis]